MPKRRRQKVTSSFHKQKTNWLFVGLITCLTVFGLVMVFDASVVEAYRDFGDKFYFFRLQAIWAAIGFAALITTAIIPLSLVKKISLPLFLLALSLLVAVLIPGIGVKVQGARRWLSIGSFTLQPSEIAKLATILYFSSWLSKHQRFVPFAFLTLTILGLVVLQPDLGTAIVIVLIASFLYFLSGSPVKNILLIAGAGLLLGLTLIVSSPYRLTRLKTFLDPASDPLGASYHIRQVLIALGSGGIFGQGIGRSRQKFEYLPEATTDSIFAVIAEETGFVGGLLVIVAFIALTNQGYKIAKNASTKFTQLVAGGITTWFATQALINLAAMVALVPLTGIPLPFISYGGSSLITALAAAGLLVNISRRG